MFGYIIWEPIVNARLRIMKGHVYFNIRDCKTLHRDWSAIGSGLRQTFVVWEYMRINYCERSGVVRLTHVQVCLETAVSDGLRFAGFSIGYPIKSITNLRPIGYPINHMWSYVHIKLHDIYIYTCIAYTYIHIHIYIYTHIYVCVCMCVWGCVCMYHLLPIAYYHSSLPICQALRGP